MRTGRIARAAALGWLVALCNAAWSQTTSPFQPPEEKVGTYVINSGAGLDTGCTYRGGGPLVIRLKIPKVVADSQLNADGTLRSDKVAALVANKVISAQAVIRFPVFDIDDLAVTDGTYFPEVDRVTFNGKYRKNLSGFNNTWTDDSIIVPIEELRFGQDNELRIDIDTANVGIGELWCMAVDWVSAEFDVAPPYVLAHGISADRSTWEGNSAPGVLAALDNMGVVYERFSLGTAQSGNGSVAANARELGQLITDWLKPMKADRVHIIAHSKGGLDSQALQATAPSFKIVSLSTLSTPHLGSVAADLSIIQKTTYDDITTTSPDPNGFVADYLGTWTFGQGPQLPGLADLTTYAATAALSAGLRNNVGSTFTVGANADLDGNNDVSAAEISPLAPAAAAYALRRAWRVLRDFQSASFTLTTVPGRFWGTRTVLTYTAVQAPTAQANDIVVTLGSANPGYGAPVGNSMANHSTVKSGANVGTFLTKTLPIK